MIFKTSRNVTITLIFSVILISSGIDLVYAERPFITTWSGENEVEIPTRGDGYNYTIDWGDDTIDTGQTDDASHIYADYGIHTVSITGDFPRIYSTELGSSAADSLITIDQWGDIEWTSMGGAFSDTENVNIIATDSPDLSRVTDMSSMFSYADYFNGDNISEWDTSNVMDMYRMFRWADSFNGDVSKWDVSNVTNMNSVFDGATSFNGDVSKWDTSSVTTMSFMFIGATSFNSDISNWDVSNVKSMNGMLSNTSLSTANYDKLLDKWSNLPILQNNVGFTSSSKYCDVGEIGRSILIDTYGWTITDAGKDTDENCDDINKWTNNGIIESTYGGFKFPDETTQTTASTGDITGVTAGAGLTGGGAIGDLTINVDTSIIQSIVTGTCDENSSIRVINSNGTVTCEIDDGITTETDPTFNSSVISNITQTDIDNWNYIKLDQSSDVPPVQDCDGIDKIGNMKVDDSSLTLYVCGYDSITTYTWMIINGDSSIIQPSPIIQSLVIGDPEDGDFVYSVDDTITIQFDSDTNTPICLNYCSTDVVHSMFTFSESLGAAYLGIWTSPDTFTITIKSINGAGPPIIGITTVTPTGVIPILSADQTSVASTNTSPVLLGGF